MMKILMILSLLLLGQQQNASDISPQKIREAYKRSFMYEKVEDYENAIRAISDVYTHFPSGYTLNLRMGWLYYLNENYANSIKHYHKAIKVAPNSLEARLGIMLPLLKQSKYNEVDSMAYHVIKKDYYNYYANLRLAVALRLQGKYDLAENICQKMLVNYPTDILFMAEKAQVLAAKKEYDQAATLFWDVLILDPENESAKKFFSLTREKE